MSSNKFGPDALGDQRRHNPGQPPLLNDIQQAQLWQVLQEMPADGNLWDAPKMAQWMSALLDRPIHPQRGWEYLKSLELRRRRPRPAHVESDIKVQTAWEKNSQPSSPTERPLIPKRPFECGPKMSIAFVCTRLIGWCGCR